MPALLEPCSSAGDDLEMFCPADYRATDVVWLWPGRIAIGKVTLLVGDPAPAKASSPSTSRRASSRERPGPTYPKPRDGTPWVFWCRLWPGGLPLLNIGAMLHRPPAFVLWVIAALFCRQATSSEPSVLPAENSVQAEILRRTRLDFNLTSDQVFKQLQENIADATPEDLARWTASGELLNRAFDGETFYFHNAVPNLFRISAEAKNRRTHEPPARKRFDLNGLIEKLIEESASSAAPEIHPTHHHVRYSIAINDGHPLVKPGATVKAWLPFPQEYRQQQGVRFITSDPPGGRVASPDAPQRSIYFEQVIGDDAKPPRFKVEFEFTTSAYVPHLDPAEVKPYDESSPLYKEFTAERKPHILITPEVRQLAAEIVGDETNPLNKALLIFRWMSKNLPWVSEMEYCTIPSLSAKGLKARCGDCGVQSLTFITLCRAVGVPARWQSGFGTKPGEENLHDWSEFYIEPYGWLPADASYGVREHDDPRVRDFFCGHMDPYRLIVNLDYGREFDPPKQSFRSEPTDFQRGEVEIDGQNLYFNEWDWEFDVKTEP